MHTNKKMSFYILPEMVTEILKKLPVKSLLRCRCVCKSWCSLISNPSFTSQHLSSSLSSPSSRTLVRHYSELHSKEIYTVYNDSDTFNIENSFNISFLFDIESKICRIVGYCNGLLCLSHGKSNTVDNIILWNPSIRRSILCPKPSTVFDLDDWDIFHLGFGFDPKNNDYKVVRISYHFRDDDVIEFPPKVEVYSVSLGKWRTIKTTTKAIIIEQDWSQAVIGSVVHWNGYSYINENCGIIHNLVLAFDLGSEELVEIGMPEAALANSSNIKCFVSTLRGLLSVAFYKDHLTNWTVEHTSRCTIWVMKDYGNVESWEQLYSIKCDSKLTMVFGTRRCGDDIFLSPQFSDGELILFNCKNGRVSSTGICGPRSSFFVDEYVESLVLLGKGEEIHGHGVEPLKNYETGDNKIEEENRPL